MPRPEFNKYPCHTHNLRISQISCLIPNSTPMPRPGIIVNYEQHQYIYNFFFFPKNKLKNVKKIFFLQKITKYWTCVFGTKLKTQLFPGVFFDFFLLRIILKSQYNSIFTKQKHQKSSLYPHDLSRSRLFSISILIKKIPKLPQPVCKRK